MTKRIATLEIDEGRRRLSAALLSAIAIQYALGVVTLVYVVPIALALTHQAIAVAIVGLWVAMVHHIRSTAEARL